MIRANGNANLFLINPNGIIFGRNASLNVGGSFVASTASSFKFADGTEFSAKAPQATPLLTVSVPIGLQYGRNAGDIRVQGVGGFLGSVQGLGLIVPEAKTLALVGGNVTLEGAFLNAPGGRIELGSVAGVGQVNLNATNQGWTLNYQGIQNFGNIQLSRSFVDIAIEEDSSIQVPGGGSAISIRASQLDLGRSSIVRANTFTSARGGDVNINVQRLTMREGAFVSTSAFSTGSGGDLTLNATESVELTGTTSGGLFATGLSTVTRGAGKAGSLTITTPVLLVRDGAQAGTATSSSGDGGSLNVNASESVQLIGTSANGNSLSGLFASSEGTGKAGSVTITTPVLLVRDGAQVLTATFSSGDDGGSLNVNASESVQLIGGSSIGEYPSGLFASTDGAGKAGSVTITTPVLLVRDGAQVSADTLGSGDGGSLNVNASKSVQLIGTSANGNSPSALLASTRGTGKAGSVTITTPVLLVRDGAQVLADTRGSGDGGSLNVNASELVELIGGSSIGKYRSGLFASTEGAGKAGSLTITTPVLLISNRAQATVSSIGEGEAGNLGITARSVRLDNGNITAQTSSGNGGNLTLDIKDLLLLRRNSQISTTAGRVEAGGDGGNITINAPNGFIVAGARENNNITANAFSGSGGRVTINATGIYGMTVRTREDLVRLLGTNLDPQLLPTNDITAISQTSPTLNGTVTVNTPDVDPNRGLVNLPTVALETEVSQLCQPRSAKNQSSFVITGRGGLPPNPRTDLLSGDAVQVDWVTLNPNSNNRTPTVIKNPTATPPQPIIEATGWVRNEKGEVVLTANPSTVTPHSPWITPASCNTKT